MSKTTTSSQIRLMNNLLSELNTVRLLAGHQKPGKQWAESLSFYLGELAAASTTFIPKLKSLRKELGRPKPNGWLLSRSIAAVHGHLLNTKICIRSAERGLAALSRMARRLPPLEHLSDEEIHRMIVEEVYRTTRRAQTRGLSHRAHRAKEASGGQSRSRCPD